MNASAVVAPTRERNRTSIEQRFGDNGYELRRDVRCVPGKNDREVSIEIECDFLEILGARQFEEMEIAIRETAASEAF